MKNCALVEELRLSVDKNLNILTGETGSGKSIIIDALGLCLGEKYSRSFLRKGYDKGIVEALFYTESKKVKEILDENGIDIEDNTVIITRELYSDGKSIARINGRNVKISLLKEVASNLIDIHSQHQNQVLFNKDTHIQFLDLFSEDIKPIKEEYKNEFENYINIKKEISILTQDKDDMQIQREIDLLKFQINEIEVANLDSNEYDDLINKRDIYRNSEKIYSNLNSAYNNLYGNSVNCVDLIGISFKEISNVSNYDKNLEDYSREIERIMYELQDISREIRNYKENINFEPYELEQIENRVDEINNLKRKYGDSIEEIFSYYKKINERLDNIINSDEKLETLKEKLKSIEYNLSKKAKLLTETRKNVAEKLKEALIDELKSLNMNNVSFEVDFEETNFYSDGKDKVEFMISFNLGEDIKPIHKVASGGEMSRFMLAFKTILSDIDEIDTLVFDEVDTGISGIAAQIVGKKLHKMGNKKQILCITHLPQIAAYADTHYYIEKNTNNDRTYTNITKLDEDKKKNEIARLIAGSNITDTTIEHAKEIIELAKGSL